MLSDTRYLARIIQGLSWERGVGPARVQRAAACRILRPMEAPFLSGAPTGAARFLTQKLDGSVPKINECLCKCTEENGNTTCTTATDTTQP